MPDVRAAARAAGVRAAARIRVYAMWHPESSAVRRLPATLRERLRLDAPPPGRRRVEIGSGHSPREGYLHVDVDPRLPVDVVARGGDLPLPSSWADELLSVHMLEHVPPPSLVPTLRRWHDVLVPGGRLTVHTPSGAALARAISSAEEPDERYWAATNALFGYGLAPWSADGPERLGTTPEHRLALTFPVLRRLLGEVGFVEVEDVSGTDDSCHHARDWADLVPGLCLEVTARRPRAGGTR